MQIDIAEKSKKVDEIKNKREEYLKINEELKSMISLGNDKEYIVYLARKNLGFSYADERVFIDIVGE